MAVNQAIDTGEERPYERLNAKEIFEAASENARTELDRTTLGLAISGLAGGFTMGLTGLAVAASQSALGGAKFAPYLFYPIGFIAVIIGRAQLFTENTLFPVIPLLDERRHVKNLLRLWGVVFLCNIVGAIVFGLLAARTGGLHEPVRQQLVQLGQESVKGGFVELFWSGVFGGWIIAFVAWLVSGSQWTIGQVAVIWLLTFIVGIGHFAHCIATSGEIMTAVWAGPLTFWQYLGWLLPATVGNIAGGVVLVSILNYGQVRAGKRV